MTSIQRSGAVVGGFLLLAVLLSPSSNGQSQTQEDADSRLHEVLTQRRDTLAELVKVVQTQYQQSQASLREVVRAQNELIQANLELAPDHTARIGLLEKRLANMKRLETSMSKAQQLGGIGQAELLSVKAERLKAEADLIRAKQKNASESR